MKNIKIDFKLVIFLLILFAYSCKQEETQDQKSISKVGITLGEIDTIHSKILNQDRELVIYIPESAKDSNRKREKYPVVYLLDGDYSFVPFIGMLKTYSEMNDTKILPEMIVVGIPNIDFDSRLKDFSPTKGDDPEQYGGGEKFLSFIKNELFPYIEKEYSGSENRTIIGHSFGGLVVMNALTNHSEMFTNYLMIDGSLYFDNELFLKNPDYSLKAKDLKDKNLYIGIANTATYGSNLESIKNDTIRANRYVRHSLDLVNQIEGLDTDLNMKWKYYENDTHGSSAFLSQLDGFRFFYSWFEFKDEHKYRGKSYIPKTDSNHFANLTKAHFKNVSLKMGYTFYPQQEWVSSNASMLLNYHKLPNQALENYELNIKYYPNNPKVYEDLADFYASQKDTTNAILNYKKALQLDDTAIIKEKLELLQ